MLSFLLGEGGQRSVRFADAAGSHVAIKLTGPGSGIAMLEGDVADLADLARLELMGTTDKSRLTISVARNGTVHGGLIEIPQSGIRRLRQSFRVQPGWSPVVPGSSRWHVDCSWSPQLD